MLLVMRVEVDGSHLMMVREMGQTRVGSDGIG